MQEKQLSSHFSWLSFSCLSFTFLITTPSFQTSPPTVLLLCVALSPFCEATGGEREQTQCLTVSLCHSLLPIFYPLIWALHSLQSFWTHACCSEAPPVTLALLFVPPPLSLPSTTILSVFFPSHFLFCPFLNMFPQGTTSLAHGLSCVL